MSDLASIVALGAWRFKKSASITAASLRRFGGFEGDIRILTDRPRRLPAGAEAMGVPSDPQPKRWKLRLPEVCDLSGEQRPLASPIAWAPTAAVLYAGSGGDGVLADLAGAAGRRGGHCRGRL